MAGKHQVRFLSFLVIYCSLVACYQPDVVSEKAIRMADLECRAIALRKERFILADSIRFTQDTLLHTKTRDSVRLNNKLRNFSDQKEKILQRSLILADTIHMALDSARKYVFKTTDDRKHFDEKVKAMIQKNGCTID